MEIDRLASRCDRTLVQQLDTNFLQSSTQPPRQYDPTDLSLKVAFLDAFEERQHFPLLQQLPKLIP